MPSSRISGCGATPIPTRPRTNSAKSITGASLTPTSTLPPASRAGRQIAAIFTFPSASRTQSTPTPLAASIERPKEEGGGETSTFPFEIWHYRYLEGIGENIDMEFVDTCQCGDYHFTIDRSEKDALTACSRRRPDPIGTDGHGQEGDRFKGGVEKLGTGTDGLFPAGQGVRPHRAGGQGLCSSADQVQGSGEFHLRAQAADRPAVSLRRAHRLRQGDREHRFWSRSRCRSGTATSPS